MLLRSKRVKNIQLASRSFPAEGESILIFALDHVHALECGELTMGGAFRNVQAIGDLRKGYSLIGIDGQCVEDDDDSQYQRGSTGETHDPNPPQFSKPEQGHYVRV